jgi:hypothetical protein
VSYQYRKAESYQSSQVTRTNTQGGGGSKGAYWLASDVSRTQEGLYGASGKICVSHNQFTGWVKIPGQVGFLELYCVFIQYNFLSYSQDKLHHAFK